LDRQVASSIFIDGLQPAHHGPAIKQDYLPQEDCAGHLARNHEGYYGKINLSKYNEQQLEN
jgi:hypothetical protein